jgi:hypothetical protein
MTHVIKIDNPIAYREIKQFLDDGVPAILFRTHASFETHVWIKQHADDFAQVLFGRPYAGTEGGNDDK